VTYSLTTTSTSISPRRRRGRVDDDELEAAYDEIVDLYDREKSTAPKRNESQLEEKFIRPMFRKLGIPFEVEESTSRTQRRPDYGSSRPRMPRVTPSSAAKGR